MNKNNWNSMSFDRINNQNGYTEDNTIVVTKFLNIAKNSYSINEFKEFLSETYFGIFEKKS